MSSHAVSVLECAQFGCRDSANPEQLRNTAEATSQQIQQLQQQLVMGIPHERGHLALIEHSADVVEERYGLSLIGGVDDLVTQLLQESSRFKVLVLTDQRVGSPQLMAGARHKR